MTQEEARTLKDHIVRLYYERYTVVQIAELTALTYRQVRDSLIERGITPRQRRLCGRHERASARRHGALESIAQEGERGRY
jgi:hypothetical protein